MVTFELTQKTALLVAFNVTIRGAAAASRMTAHIP